jgi:hypothetical protein
MQNAIALYIAATTEAELVAAYEAMVEVYAADTDLPDDADFESGVDQLLSDMGMPSFAQRQNEVQA